VTADSPVCSINLSSDIMGSASSEFIRGLYGNLQPIRQDR
jgi:hypothetical protein